MVYFYFYKSCNNSNCHNGMQINTFLILVVNMTAIKLGHVKTMIVFIAYDNYYFHNHY